MVGYPEWSIRESPVIGWSDVHEEVNMDLLAERWRLHHFTLEQAAVGIVVAAGMQINQMIQDSKSLHAEKVKV